MEEFGVPSGLIYRAPDMLEDPHFQAREAIVTVPHPGFRRAQDAERRAEAFARRLAHALAESALGQHNDEVYLRTARA